MKPLLHEMVHWMGRRLINPQHNHRRVYKESYHFIYIVIGIIDVPIHYQWCKYDLKANMKW